MKNIVLSLFAIFFTGVAISQTFEGVIEFKIEAPGESESVQSMMPKKSVSYIKGKMVRTVITSPMAGEMVTIVDGEKGKTYQLLDIMGSKKCIVVNTEENNQDYQINYLDETKEIVGYECKKVEIIHDENVAIAWVTDKIKANTQNQLGKKLKGFPLSYEMSNQGMEMILTAVKVEKKKIDDDNFVVPSEYEKISMEEAQQMMQGQ
ncbi:DUF4412 domain-containing protein [Salibacter halophilus]|uniref:DUF4412 domain-containing protein n=1 Tax=Salibacter halophilus TaxID=1803916 RepID=A0A6N6MAV5_9FLAO|nr:DUF4412 domain-containing protein [Salibacter halophilus]KAB1064376.1 DUF4412 domain-containing protein [Salibacter halophilus]